MERDWNKLTLQVKECGLCAGLNDTKLGTQNAPGYGNTTSQVMLVGQSLCGKPCIDSQIPFTGGSGLLLDEAFTLAGVAKSDLYITNVVKCHPPGNRVSFDFEIKNCTPYLQTELDWINPTDVICLGKDAWQFFDDTVRKPKTSQINGRRIHFVYHPAYIRRKPKPERDQYINELSEIISGAWRC
jgi:uracil-DNA glycosylase